ncbi:MAG: EamA family transporter [Frankiales bacterium]|nr:EamA family transporter [Frankiales bacterium]
MSDPGRRGLTLAVLSAASFGTSGAFAASLLDAGWTPGAAVTIRVVIAALVLTGPALLQMRGRLSLLGRGSRTFVPYGIFAVAGAQLGFFQAVERLSVGVALLLEYSGALLVVAWMWARHGQRPRRLTIAGAGAAIVGLALVLDLLGDRRLDVVGVLWGLCAAVGLAVYFVLSAGGEDPLPSLVVAWGGLVVGAVVLMTAIATGVLPASATFGDVTLLDTRVSWLVPVAGLALLAAVVAYVSGIGAARLLGARLASFVGLTEVLFAVAFAALLVGQIPTGLQLAGGLLVLAGVALVRLDEPAPQVPALT